MRKSRMIKTSYDEEADVLYVTFGTEEPSYGEEIDDFLLLERGIKTKNITGYRLIGFKEKLDRVSKVKSS